MARRYEDHRTPVRKGAQHSCIREGGWRSSGAKLHQGLWPPVQFVSAVRPAEQADENAFTEGPENQEGCARLCFARPEAFSPAQ
jgi:hypothetical protein